MKKVPFLSLLLAGICLSFAFIPSTKQKTHPYVKLTTFKTANGAAVVFGTVADHSTNEPIPGVTVLIKNTQAGTMTDYDGKYSLILPSDSLRVLRFSLVGYTTQDVTVKMPAAGGFTYKNVTLFPTIDI